MSAAEQILAAINEHAAGHEWTAVVVGPDKSKLVLTGESRADLFAMLAELAPYQPAMIL